MLVTCNGCFNLLHPGHMFYLGFCRGQGDELVVGINSDSYIRRHKEREPIPEKERIDALMALGFIKQVHVFWEDDPSLFIKMIRPDIHCTGEEYEGRCPEQVICEEIGAKLVFVPRVGHWSSSMMRERCKEELLSTRGCVET